MFLKYSDMWDMRLGSAPESDPGVREIPHWFGNLAYVAVGGAFKLCFRYRVDHREKLRAFQGESGVLVVCNHTSFLDVCFMYLTARTSQWMRLMGRESLFDNAGGLLGQILSRVGAFPVKRDSADRTSIKRAARMLKRREIVGILPEGTRRGKGSKASEIHSGAALVARMGHAPILPMTVRNAEYVKQKGQRVRFPKITIEYGDPVLLEDFDFLPKDDRLDGCTWYAMRECFALSQQVPPEQVDMRALFPTGKDFTDVFAAHPVPRHTSEEVVAAIRAERAEKERKAAARVQAAAEKEAARATSDGGATQDAAGSATDAAGAVSAAAPATGGTSAGADAVETGGEGA